MRAFWVVALLCVSGCSWFHGRKPQPDPPELIVTGAPAGSQLFIDGLQAGQAKEDGIRPQEVFVRPGSHVVEVRTGDTVAYRENVYVESAERRVITVLSGNRN